VVVGGFLPQDGDHSEAGVDTEEVEDTEVEVVMEEDQIGVEEVIEEAL